MTWGSVWILFQRLLQSVELDWRKMKVWKGGWFGHLAIAVEHTVFSLQPSLCGGAPYDHDQVSSSEGGVRAGHEVGRRPGQKILCQWQADEEGRGGW